MSRNSGQYSEATLDQWYSSRRPDYAPRTPKVLVRMAQKFMEKEFPRLLQEDGLLPHLCRAIEHTFRHFDPAVGSPKHPDLSVGERFLLAFYVWGRQLLKKPNKHLKRQPYLGSSVRITVSRQSSAFQPLASRPR